MKGAALVSSTGQAALNHPFIGSDYADLPGLPIGINVRTRQLVCIDFWLLKRLGNIHSTFVQIFGPKDCGKSALMKWIVLLGCMRVAEYDRMRVVIHDRKPEGKDSEYGPLSARQGVLHLSWAKCRQIRLRSDCMFAVVTRRWCTN